MQNKDDCEQIKLLLDAYHDGEALPAERELVERHLDVCRECKRSLSEIEMIAGSMRDLPEIKMPRDYADNFEAVLAQRTKPSDKSCAEIAMLLDAYFDNELEDAEHEAVANHLPGCDECNRGLSEIERVVASLKQLPPVALKQDYAENFETILAQRGARNIVWFKQRRTWAATAIAASLLIIAFVSNHSGNMISNTVTAVAPPQATTAQIAMKPESTPAVQPTATESTGSRQGTEQVTPNENGTRNHEIATSKVEVKDSYKHRTNESVVNRQANFGSETPMVAQSTTLVQAPASSPKVQSGAPDAVATSLNDGNRIQGEVSSNRMIASANTKAAAADLNNSEELIALYDSEANPAEDLGLTTDEDGLYAIKL